MKMLARILGALLTLVIVAALAAPLFISPDALKAQLVAQVKKATGRTLEIKGETHVTLFPTIAVSAQDVTLSNPDGFTTPYLIRVKRLQTGAELRPLLRGELIVNGITLDGADVNLERLASGASNWEFTQEKLQESAEQAADAPEAQKQSRSPIKRFALGDITVSDSSVHWLQPGANVVTLAQIGATLRGADANSPLAFEGAAEFRGEQVSMALDLAKTREFLAEKPSPLTVSLKLPGASLDFSGDARMGEKPEASGKLAANAASLPSVLAWATGKAPSAALPEQVSVNAQAAYAGKNLRLSEATLRADGTKAEGSVAIDIGKAVPQISGNLRFGAIDADALLGTARTEPNAPARNAPIAPAAWDDRAIDLSGLGAVNAKLDLACEQITRGKLALGATQASAVLQGGKLALTIHQSQLYGGTLSGVVRAAANKVGADLTLRGIDINAAMTALSGDSRLAGKADLAFKGAASGNSQAEWVQSLGGNGSIRVTDGALTGINIGSFLRNARQGNFFRSDTESTDFSELTASFSIDRGVLSNKDLAMKSPALRVAGSGMANLPARTLHYRLVPTLAETSKGQGGKDTVQGLTIPLVITGSWSNPSVTPDVAGMAADALRDPAAFKQNLEGLKQGIKNFNSPDDLRRALFGGSRKAAAEAPAPAPVPTPAVETPPVAPDANSPPIKSETPAPAMLEAPPESEAVPASAETPLEPAPEPAPAGE